MLRTPPMFRSSLIAALLLGSSVACDSKPADSAAKTDGKAKSDAKPDAKAKADAKVAAKPETETKTETKTELAARTETKADAPQPVAEKPAGPAPKIEASWVEVDQGGIEGENLPAISTDGATIAHLHEVLGGGESLVFRSRAGAVEQTIELLSVAEYEAAKDVPALEGLVGPRITEAHAAIAKRGWNPLVGGSMTPDEMAKSGLVATVAGDRLTITKDGAEVFAKDVAKRQPCEKPSVHGVWRDADATIAYAVVTHSLSKCEPAMADEHHVVPLK